MEELRIIAIGGSLETPNGLIIVKETASNFCCEFCVLFKNKKCTAPKWIKNPICFANERYNNKSVYFIQRKIK